MEKDWVGNDNSVYKIISASNHSDAERADNDFYATDPIAIDKLIAGGGLPKCSDTSIWEPACGQGHLSERLKSFGYNVFSSDLVDRGYAGMDAQLDFLECKAIPEPVRHACDIVTNPPYKYATEFALHAYDLLKLWHSSYMFVKLTFLESKKRYDRIFSKIPPDCIYVFKERVLCGRNGDFEETKRNGGSAVAYMWVQWTKKPDKLRGEPVIHWI